MDTMQAGKLVPFVGFSPRHESVIDVEIEDINGQKADDETCYRWDLTGGSSSAGHHFESESA